MVSKTTGFLVFWLVYQPNSMLCVSPIDELKTALDAELKAKTTETVAIFEREFPGTSLGEPDEPYSSWSGKDNVLSNYDGIEPIAL